MDLYLIQHAAGHGRIGNGALTQGLCGQVDIRQRRAQLMRQVGDKVTPRPPQPLQLGHVFDRNRRAPPFTDRRGPDAQGASTDRSLPGDRPIPGRGVDDRLVQLGVPDQTDEGQADRRIGHFKHLPR